MSFQFKPIPAVNLPICLAPMVGISHAVLRNIISDYLPNNVQLIWPTEMLNSRKIPHEKLGRTAETFLYENDRSLVPQILGNDESIINQAITKMNQEWRTSSGHNPIVGIDINMGCPVQKALKHNYGVSLMGDVKYASDVVSFTVNASNCPVSVKLRAVKSDQPISDLIHFVEALSDAGASWITLHPRTADQQRKGNADWNQITQLKYNLKIPIIGNGDIQTYDDIYRMMQETGCDMVMVGRALAARPWMILQYIENYEKQFLNSTDINGVPTPYTEEQEGAEYGRVLLKFIDLSEKFFVNNLGLSFNYTHRKIVFFVKTTHVWLQFGHTLYAQVTKATNMDELKATVKTFFDTTQRMSKRTELRQ